MFEFVNISVGLLCGISGLDFMMWWLLCLKKFRKVEWILFKLGMVGFIVKWFVWVKLVCCLV